MSRIRSKTDSDGDLRRVEAILTPAEAKDTISGENLQGSDSPRAWEIDEPIPFDTGLKETVIRHVDDEDFVPGRIKVYNGTTPILKISYGGEAVEEVKEEIEGVIDPGLNKQQAPMTASNREFDAFHFNDFVNSDRHTVFPEDPEESDIINAYGQIEGQSYRVEAKINPYPHATQSYAEVRFFLEGDDPVTHQRLVERINPDAEVKQEKDGIYVASETINSVPVSGPAQKLRETPDEIKVRADGENQTLEEFVESNTDYESTENWMDYYFRENLYNESYLGGRMTWEGDNKRITIKNGGSFILGYKAEDKRKARQGLFEMKKDTGIIREEETTVLRENS